MPKLKHLTADRVHILHQLERNLIWIPDLHPLRERYYIPFEELLPPVLCLFQALAFEFVVIFEYWNSGDAPFHLMHRFVVRFRNVEAALLFLVILIVVVVRALILVVIGWWVVLLDGRRVVLWLVLRLIERGILVRLLVIVVLLIVLFRVDIIIFLKLDSLIMSGSYFQHGAAIRLILSQDFFHLGSLLSTHPDLRRFLLLLLQELTSAVCTYFSIFLFNYFPIARHLKLRCDKDQARLPLLLLT